MDNVVSQNKTDKMRKSKVSDMDRLIFQLDEQANARLDRQARELRRQIQLEINALVKGSSEEEAVEIEVPRTK